MFLTTYVTVCTIYHKNIVKCPKDTYIVATIVFLQNTYSYYIVLQLEMYTANLYSETYSWKVSTKRKRSKQLNIKNTGQYVLEYRSI